MTPLQHERIEAIAQLIDLLDLLDGDPDFEDSDVDRCEAEDDAPVSSHCPQHYAGDPGDAELNGDEEEPSATVAEQ